MCTGGKASKPPKPPEPLKDVDELSLKEKDDTQKRIAAGMMSLDKTKGRLNSNPIIGMPSVMKVTKAM